MNQGDGSNKPSVAGPGFQLKYLFTDGKEARFPATGIVGGATPPFGLGVEEFRNPSWGTYLYAVVTQFFFKDLETFNLHINVGFNNSYGQQRAAWSLSYGIGVQARMFDKLYLCTEVYQGDPYAITPGALYQVGLRYFINDEVQMDLATGKGIYGDPMLSQYVSFGLRMVIDTNKKK